MTLSIIIVNYNVKYFLEQCLHALQKAVAGLDAEIIVVDNGSTDDSVAYLSGAFPKVQFIASATNLGFAKACNRGLAQATGDAILFLNPDTIVAEDTLHICLNFLKTHAGAGALGVRMIDGAGAFLKESKRSFPSPLTSLFKLAGLARAFPRSPLFSRYHLGHLDARRNHEVDVLAGAFMLVRKSVLEQVGAFDEAFFMYGEDVDLSYRIQKAGYKNYYVAETEIIHFKGESTKRGSFNYVRMFYSAMRTFVKKHYGGSRAAVFNWAIHLAIWARAALSVVAKGIGWVGLPVLDAALFMASFRAIKEVWVRAVKPQTIYPDALLGIAFPVFTLLYLVVAYYAGLYDKQYKPARLASAAVLATLALLALYALLPEHLRFSRGMLLFGALLALAGMALLRWSLTAAKILPKAIYTGTKPYILIGGSLSEYEEVKKLIPKVNNRAAIIGRLAVTEDGVKSLGLLSQAWKIGAALNAQDLILCSGTATNKTLINLIQTGRGGLRLRFHAAGSRSIVGSDSSTASGEALTSDIHFSIAQPVNRRLKRLLDVATALLFLLFFPLSFRARKPLLLLANAVQVLLGQKTWIGYAAPAPSLPLLRPAVLTSDGEPVQAVLKKLDSSYFSIDAWYAQHYEPWQDVKHILKNYRHLGG